MVYFSDVYIRLKFEPSGVGIGFWSCQAFVLPSTVFELTPLMHCGTIRLVLRPVPSTTSTPYKRSFNNRSVTFSRKVNLGIYIYNIWKTSQRSILRGVRLLRYNNTRIKHFVEWQNFQKRLFQCLMSNQYDDFTSCIYIPGILEICIHSEKKNVE